VGGRLGGRRRGRTGVGACFGLRRVDCEAAVGRGALAGNLVATVRLAGELDEIEAAGRVLGRIGGDELNSGVVCVDAELFDRGARRERGHGTALTGRDGKFDVNPVGHTCS
jgi:hypothetical protein